MIRSPLGAVWIQLSRDMDGDESTPPHAGEEDEGSIDNSILLTLPDEEGISHGSDDDVSL